MTVWLDTETWRPVETRLEGRVARNGTVVTGAVTFRFTYDESIRVDRPAFDPDAVWTLGCPGAERADG